jgi:DnaK suppressor protein
MDTAKVQKLLEKEQQRLTQEIVELEQEDPANDKFRDVNNTDDDDSMESEDHARIQARIDTSQTNLAKVVKALKKIEAGTYGTCERCGKEIAAKRLEFVPWAIYDIECEEIIESGKR